MVKQLALQLQFPDNVTFDNFFVGDNQQLLSAIDALLSNDDQQPLYLWGDVHTGRSHLLQASCHRVTEQGNAAAFLPLKNLVELSPNIMQDMDQLALVCIDDIDAIAGHALWEEALFHFYNQALASGTRFMISAALPPKGIDFGLPDLQSRLSALMSIELKPLQDTHKVAAIKLRAEHRGFTLTDEVVQFVLSHYQRDMQALVQLLEILDHASLMAKRKITIPFVKSVIEC